MNNFKETVHDEYPVKMTCRFYDADDFRALLSDLCDDETSCEDTSSLDSSKGKSVSLVKVLQSGNKKTKVIASDNGIVEFAAYYPKPKVIHTDIRRSYGNMFVNAMNSGDLPVLYGFLDTFLVPDATKIARKNMKCRQDQMSLPHTHVSEQKGIVEIARNWYCRMQMSPDMVVGVKNMQIVSNSKTDETKVLSRFTLKATKLIGEAHPTFCKNHGCGSQSGPVCTSCNKIRQCHRAHRLLSTDNTVGKKRQLESEQNIHKENMREIVATVEELISTIPKRAEPIMVEVEGDLVISIDEHRRITRLEMSIDL